MTQTHKIFADLHIHSKYSRACSKNLIIKNLSKYSRIKGINLLGTGDFTHPKWREELRRELTMDTTNDSGFMVDSTGFNYIPSTEVSLIYSQKSQHDDKKGRRVHNVILAPDMEVADQVTEEFLKLGRVDYDGRPIFKLSCIELVEKMKSISQDIEVIPAHIWTPFFGVFGSKSGFNSMKDAFGEYAKDIHAIETGISSDPEMNLRVADLKNRSIVSFSDAHSYHPHRIGRESTIFEIKKSYKDLLGAIRTNDKRFVGTNEFWPDEGKYHYDGHRNCHIMMKPSDSIKINNICPVCKRGLTVGVLHRVEELASEPEGYSPSNAKPFTKTIPLAEVIAHTYHIKSVSSKKVSGMYEKLINAFGTELNILFDVTEANLKKICEPLLVENIIRNRNGDVTFIPGFDGEYGKPIFDKSEAQKELEKLNSGLNTKTQMSINDY